MKSEMRNEKGKMRNIRVCDGYRNSYFSSHQGFTLIELLIVFGLIGMLTSIGIVSFTSYSNAQSVQTATADILNLVTTAKSRAISQVKPPECENRTLSGYTVMFTNPRYVLLVVCGGNVYELKSQELPTGVSFASGTPAQVTFAVPSGTSTQNTIYITGYGKNRSITISSTGSITTN